MKKYVDLVKENIELYKKYYLFIFVLFIMGVIFGSMLIPVIKPTEQNLALGYFEQFINNVKDDNFSISISAFIDSITINFLYIIIIWLMGISVIGVPIIVMLVFLKGFVVGFSIGLVVFKYKLLGLIGSILYVLPHNFFAVGAIFIVSMYAILFSMNLSLSVIKKTSISFKNIMGKYLRVGMWSLVAMLTASIIEIFIMPYLIKLFLLMI